MFTYAGIGSRETPNDVLDYMYRLGGALAQAGWMLRSGHAGGADMAFERGAIAGGGAKEIYIPWIGFNGAPRNHLDYVVAPLTDDAATLAAAYHPAWERCSPGAKALHLRNSYQVLGIDLKSPANMVVCWTKCARGGGGTGQAIRIAHSRNIPVFDLADPEQKKAMGKFVDALMK